MLSESVFCDISDLNFGILNKNKNGILYGLYKKWPFFGLHKYTFFAVYYAYLYIVYNTYSSYNIRIQFILYHIV